MSVKWRVGYKTRGWVLRPYAMNRAKELLSHCSILDTPVLRLKYMDMAMGENLFLLGSACRSQKKHHPFGWGFRLTPFGLDPVDQVIHLIPTSLRWSSIDCFTFTGALSARFSAINALG